MAWYLGNWCVQSEYSALIALHFSGLIWNIQFLGVQSEYSAECLLLLELCVEMLL